MLKTWWEGKNTQAWKSWPKGCKGREKNWMLEQLEELSVAPRSLAELHLRDQNSWLYSQHFNFIYKISRCWKKTFLLSLFPHPWPIHSSIKLKFKDVFFFKSAQKHWAAKSNTAYFWQNTLIWSAKEWDILLLSNLCCDCTLMQIMHINSEDKSQMLAGVSGCFVECENRVSDWGQVLEQVEQFSKFRKWSLLYIL